MAMGEQDVANISKLRTLDSFCSRGDATFRTSAGMSHNALYGMNGDCDFAVIGKERWQVGSSAVFILVCSTVAWGILYNIAKMIVSAL